uniref:PH0730-like N-terminal domain-containing protein n=1 Tax=Fervidicoccus fontis TaxID=683846 RepID=A0A7J3ZMF8_9CREN
MSVIKEAGPSSPTGYTEADVLGALIALRDLGRIGRSRLSRILGIGEGSLRGLLKNLEKARIIERSRSGVSLVKWVARELSSMHIAEFAPASSVIPWERVVLVQLCNVKPRLDYKGVIEVRDNTLRWGSLGCIIATIEHGRLKITGLENYGLVREIESELQNYITDCDGVLGVIGCDKRALRWALIYGFLEGVCWFI